jgi:hypothetical protein
MINTHTQVYQRPTLSLPLHLSIFSSFFPSFPSFFSSLLSCLLSFFLFFFFFFFFLGTGPLCQSGQHDCRIGAAIRVHFSGRQRVSFLGDGVWRHQQSRGRAYYTHVHAPVSEPLEARGRKRRDGEMTIGLKIFVMLLCSFCNVFFPIPCGDFDGNM